MKRSWLGCFGVAALCLLPVPVLAQRASLQGMVTSASTGGPLEGVLVELRSGGQQVQGAITDRNGFYQLGQIVPGTYTLRAQLIGYLDHEHELTLQADARERSNFELEPSPVVLEGITVAVPRGAAVREQGRQRITPGDLRLAPLPAGTGDLATYLQTLPGVTTTGDRGGQLFVRGGTPAENLVLVDGIPIYHPFHIIGFFSVFPEDLVSSADFYAGGFGARYDGRTSSVLDVRIRDGDRDATRTVASVSPFLAEAVVQGPAGTGVTWLASVRRSLVEQTSQALTGETQPLTFDSQLLKLTATDDEGRRCSGLALRTSDRGRMSAVENDSRVAWSNFVLGARCVTQLSGIVRLLEAGFSYSSAENSAVSRGSSEFSSRIQRLHADGHGTRLLGRNTLHLGYRTYLELVEHDLSELFGFAQREDVVSGLSTYAELTAPLFDRLELRPGLVLTLAPRFSLEPRLRASYEPRGRASERLTAAFGLYRQDVTGTSDMRDVGSVFTAWLATPEGAPLEALHGMVGWQQSLGERFRWSVEGYYKQLDQVPVPIWRAVASFTTRLGRASGEVLGADTRLELTAGRAYGFLGYGYSRTTYEAAQAQFSTWFGTPVQRFHPPHDRRHQLNALVSYELADFKASARWQLGSGLPFTRPLGFDEAFDFTEDLHDTQRQLGRPRLVLDRPFTGRMPSMHRLDLAVERTFNLDVGMLQLQAGAINVYDRRNIFYYDLYAGRRVDQLPLAPYASVTLRSW